jgi:hypothetical protein
MSKASSLFSLALLAKFLVSASAFYWIVLPLWCSLFWARFRGMVYWIKRVVVRLQWWKSNRHQRWWLRTNHHLIQQVR